MVGQVGFEPTVDFRRAIMSRGPATNTASGPSLYNWSGVRESNPHLEFRRLLSYPLNERQLLVPGAGLEPARLFGGRF